MTDTLSDPSLNPILEAIEVIQSKLDLIAEETRRLERSRADLKAKLKILIDIRDAPPRIEVKVKGEGAHKLCCSDPSVDHEKLPVSKSFDL